MLPSTSFHFIRTSGITIAILVLCLVPSAEITKLNVQIDFADLIVHYIMFFVFSAVLFLDISKAHNNSNNRVRIAIMVFLLSMFLGGITELMQYLIKDLNRTGSMLDLMYDFLGSMSGIVFMFFIKRK